MSEEKPVNYFEFREVCKSFDERLVLDHVSFAVFQGSGLRRSAAQGDHGLSVRRAL